MLAFVRLRAPDAKAFCQSSACVPGILLRLASVCMGEWVNTVGRIASFLIAKALNFKIRENSRLRRVFRVRVIRVSVFRVSVFLRTVASSPIASTECIHVGCAKTQKTRNFRVSPALPPPSNPPFGCVTYFCSVIQIMLDDSPDNPAVLGTRNIVLSVIPVPNFTQQIRMLA